MEFVASVLLLPLKFLAWLGPRRRRNGEGESDGHISQLYALRQRVVLWWLMVLLGVAVAYLLGSSANGLQDSPMSAALREALNIASDVAFVAVLLGCAVATYCSWQLYRFEGKLFGD